MKAEKGMLFISYLCLQFEKNSRLYYYKTYFKHFHYKISFLSKNIPQKIISANSLMFRTAKAVLFYFLCEKV